MDDGLVPAWLIEWEIGTCQLAEEQTSALLCVCAWLTSERAHFWKKQ